jgi:hypothetical protein
MPILKIAMKPKITKEEIRNKIKAIKWARLSPAERFLIPIFNNLTEYHLDKYPNCIFYKYKGEIYFKHDKKNGVFWFSYYKIYEVLESKYNINYIEQRELIKGMVWEVLKLKVGIIFTAFNNNRLVGVGDN